jgi:hypothetical protein
MFRLLGLIRNGKTQVTETKYTNLIEKTAVDPALLLKEWIRDSDIRGRVSAIFQGKNSTPHYSS